MKAKLTPELKNRLPQQHGAKNLSSKLKASFKTKRASNKRFPGKTRRNTRDREDANHFPQCGVDSR